MSDLQTDTLHLSKVNNPAVEEFFATKSPGDTGELTVTYQIRDLTESGVVLDVTSADASESFAEPMPESANAESIAAVMGGSA